MSREFLFFRLILTFVVLASSPFLSCALQARPTGKGLALVGQPSITIDDPSDQSCSNPQGTGQGWVKVRNEGSAPIALAPAAASLISKSPAKRLMATPKATVVADLGSGQPSDQKSLAPGKEAWVKIDVSGVNEDGDWETTLKNDGVNIGSIGVIRAAPPLKLTLDVPNPNAPELTFVLNKPASFGWKNDDGENYTINWEYTVDGSPVGTAGTPPAPGKCWNDNPGTTTNVEILSGSYKAISFWPRCNWFGSRFVGLFKDASSDARLVAHKVDKCGRTSSKVFNIKTHLATMPENSREVWSDIVVFAILLLGGFFSVLLNFAFPRHIQKSKLSSKLAELHGKTSNLSTRLASRVRVLAGLDERILEERLSKLNWTSSDFVSEIQGIEQATTQLEKRIQILEAMGDTRDRFECLCRYRLPPAKILEMEAAFEEIIGIVNTTMPDVQKAQDKINDLKKQLEVVGQKDDKFAADLHAWCVAARKDISETGLIGKTETWKRIHEHWCDAVAIIEKNGVELEKEKGIDHILPEDYVKVGRAVYQINLLKSYILKIDCLPKNDARRNAIATREEKLFKLLMSHSGEAVYLASRLMTQIEEGIFREDIEKAVGNQVRIKTQSLVFVQFQPCVFKLEFLDRALDTAAAREDWICQWEFTHPLEPPLTEEGWEVTHYFQRADCYEFKVTLIPRFHGEASEVEAIPALKVKVTETREIIETLDTEMLQVTDTVEVNETLQPKDVNEALRSKKTLQVVDPRFLQPKAKEAKDAKDAGIAPYWMRVRVLPKSPPRFPVVVWRTFFGPEKKGWLEWKESQPATGRSASALRFLVGQWKRSQHTTGRFWQILWFFLSLLLVLIGMIAGAKEQILKLDLIPAFIAIFLAGFGADHIKNLLSQTTAQETKKKE